MGRRRPRYVNVISLVRATRPNIADPAAAIAARLLMVDGRIVTSTRTLVPAGAPVVLRQSRSLRGEDKLRAALDAFGVDVGSRICLDIGASAGGFTRVLLEHGAAKVIAVDAGYGQLRGSLRAHPRVVSLERTNLSDLGWAVPRCWIVEVVTMDLSYLSVAAAVPQLEAARLAETADLVALVKPMYELGLAAPPSNGRQLLRAVERACRGVERGRRWLVEGIVTSPVPGARGSREWLIHARRTSPAPDRWHDYDRRGDPKGGR